MKTDAIRLGILKTIGSKEACGYEVRRRLAESGEQVEIGRLYKILIEMFTEGLLACRWEKSKKGPEKRIYRLTPQGKKELDKDLLKAIATIHSYYGQYLLNLPSRTSIFEGFARMAVPEKVNVRRIALYATSPNSIHEPLFAAFQKQCGAIEICLVYPHQVESSLGERKLVSLQGDYDSIPLRERYLDLLLVEGLPDSTKAVRSVEEWHRVLKNDATLVVIAPKALFSTLKDPLTIGDFIEKMEHEVSSSEEVVDGETLQHLLEECFLKVHRKEMLQMTILVCRGLGSALLPSRLGSS